MQRHHKIAIGGFGTIVIIFMIITGVVLNGVIVKQSIQEKELNQKIEELEKNFDDKLNELAVTTINLKHYTQTGFVEINKNISSVSMEIGKIQASTSDDFSNLIVEAVKSVVTVRTLYMQGTGFIINETGYLITNQHILLYDNSTSKLIQVITSDGKVHSGELIGYDETLDLALIKIDGDFQKLNFGNSDEIKIGEKVIAIGNPEGFQFSVTDGIVSATKRAGINNMNVYIQTNAELNQGNSGGPLINKYGEVIGINNFKLANAEGIGFALESNVAKKGINDIYFKSYNETLIN